MADDAFKQILAEIELHYDKFGSKEQLEQLRNGCQRYFSGKLFISHTAADAAWCKRYILRDVAKKYQPDSYFFLSRADSAFKVDTHRVAVEFAFRYTKTILCVVSRRSVLSNWTKLEALWAVEQRHPLVVCLLDEADPKQLHRHLLGRRWQLRPPPRAVVDFSKDPDQGTTALMGVLERPEFAPDFDRFPLALGD